MTVHTLSPAADQTESYTLDEIKTWPATVGIARACKAIGISPSHGYSLAGRGEFPCRVLQPGGRYRVVTASLVRLLSESDDGGGAAA